MNEPKILAIESSCDETSAAVISGGELRSNIIATQIDIHALYGGVVPEIASRQHLISMPAVVSEALKAAECELADIDAVAVTYGPGLVGALLIGVSYAKALCYASGKRLIGVNHMAGHIAANYLCGAIPPFLALVVSGGHTMLVRVNDYTDFSVLGQTRDDAAGEAFDKVARVLGLAYPGGAKLDALAETGDSSAYTFPRAMLKEANFDFSFSGMKSAALNIINQSKMKGAALDRANLAASFREAVIEILVEKTLRAAREQNLSTIAICGGVACNDLLRRRLSERSKAEGKTLILADKLLCSDNAGMIASMAYRQYLKENFSDMFLNAVPSLSL